MPSTSIKLGLERMQRLLGCLSNPHLKIPIIHVAGTNGKGSVCAFEAEILRSSGFKVGRFTSPYLLEPADSITLNGENINHDEFEETKKYIEDLAKKRAIDASSFEVLTAVSFELFARPRFNLDLAVIEVGLGGAADSTNVCGPGNTLFSCITPISLDHQGFLGSTVAEISAQKAGIAKPHVPILLAHQAFPEVEGTVRSMAHTKSCDVFVAHPYPVPHPSSSPDQLAPLPITPIEDQAASAAASSSASSSLTIPNPLSPGAAFQHQNAVTAATLAHLLRAHPHPRKLLPSLCAQITDQSISEGLKNTRWRGRAELVRYKSCEVLLDGAHNQASAEQLGSHISALDRPTTVIVSLSTPREPAAFIQALGLGRLSHPVQLISTRFSAPKLMDWVLPVDPECISHQGRAILGCSDGSTAMITRHPAEALDLAMASARGPDELIVVCGSLYLISDVLKIINGLEPGSLTS